VGGLRGAAAAKICGTKHRLASYLYKKVLLFFFFRVVCGVWYVVCVVLSCCARQAETVNPNINKMWMWVNNYIYDTTRRGRDNECTQHNIEYIITIIAVQ